jgi:hypothetical protein
VYFIGYAREHGLASSEIATSLYAMVVLGGMLALLWIWTAICCARRKPSWLALATMGLGAAEVAYFSVPAFVRMLVGAAAFDAVDTGRVLLEIALVAAVIVWRPRSHEPAPSAPAP